MEVEIKLPTIQNLNEIKTCGHYQLNTGTLVIADAFGISEFTQCKLSPMTIVNPNGDTYQVMIDANGIRYFRPRVDNEWGIWYNLNELTELLSAIS